MGDLFGQNGVILEELEGVWDRAEAATWEVIRRIQPTVVSEERRKDVIEYVQGLLKSYLSCEVLPFGSVPLKTFLPDGDIDLTAFCGFKFENAFANDVYTVLEAESRNPAANFVVKGVQYIHAEVKLVKCFIQNIVVDISFNQIGGLCTLGFLEEIDRLIGKDHLFKRSIILIKAWCYHESRILGAHHGLISSYALETLVLYIFHVFNSSLNGPLAVLHKFLDYFSKFDWENFCVSLSGPVHIASLPEVVAERPEASSKDVLLSDDFIRECVRKFSAPSEIAEINYKTFMPKYLNVVDPLNQNNNLGRSVSKGNFFRIRSAFLYGAQQLGQILLQPQENIAEQVHKFFISTLNRHEKGPRPDVQELRQVSSCNGFAPKMSLPLTEPNQDQIYTHEEDYAYSSDCSFEDTKHVVGRSFWEHGSDSERITGSEEFSASASPLSEYAIERSISVDFPHGPYPYFPHPLENGKMEMGYLDDRLSSTASNSRSSSVDTDAHSWQSSNSVYQNSRLAGTGRHNTLNVFPDLSGDVDCHLLNVQYGRWWFDNGSSMPIQPRHQFPPMFQPNVSWDVLHQAMSVMNVNGVIPSPAFFPAYPPAAPKPRGIGTYFPDPHSYKEKASGRRRCPGRSRASRSNGRAPTPPVKSPHAQGPFRQGIDRPVFSDNHARSPREKIYRNTNGFVQALEKVRPPKSGSCNAPESNSSSELENIEPIFCVDDSRFSVKSYRLKDEDFPPL